MRRLTKIETTPSPAPGFIGPGHTAVEVLGPAALERSDPFVLLMDDRLDIRPRRQIGGAHPHAGLETVTFLLEGKVTDRDEGELSEGDVVWMTAGRGIIHNEAVEAEGRSRVLQLWVRLPARDRDLQPSFEIVRRDAAPLVREGGASVRLYSGALGDVAAATKNRVPVTFADLRLAPGASWAAPLPATHTGFLYVLEGAITNGEVTARNGEVAWIDRPGGGGALPLVAGPEGARAALYAGVPQGEPLVHHGPFVAGSYPEIHALFQRFRSGAFVAMSSLTAGAGR